VENWRVARLGEMGQILREKKFKQDKTIIENCFWNANPQATEIHYLTFLGL
jgi:hypothetical protein